MKVSGTSHSKHRFLFLLTPLLLGGLILALFPTKATVSLESPKVKYLRVHLRHVARPDLSNYHVQPYLLPVPEVAGISSPFGMRHHPLLDLDRLHAGVDFPVLEGTPVLAAANGVVSLINTPHDSAGYGNAIVLAHDEWYATRYAHLAKIFVVADQVVLAGDTIGLSGNTGLSTEAHLHYEVLLHGKPIDPIEYLPPLIIFPPTLSDSLLTDTLQVQML